MKSTSTFYARVNGREVVDIDAAVQSSLLIQDEVAQGQHLPLYFYQALAVHVRVEVASDTGAAQTARQQDAQHEQVSSTHRQIGVNSASSYNWNRLR